MMEKKSQGIAVGSLWISLKLQCSKSFHYGEVSLLISSFKCLLKLKVIIFHASQMTMLTLVFKMKDPLTSVNIKRCYCSQQGTVQLWAVKQNFAVKGFNLAVLVIQILSFSETGIFVCVCQIILEPGLLDLWFHHDIVFHLEINRK